MKINRTELIQILENHVKTAQYDRQRRHENAVREWEQSAEKHFARTNEAWYEFADVIRTKIAAGKNIVRTDVPKSIKSGSYDLLFFDNTKRKPIEPTPTEQERQIMTLINMLKQTSDEHVSTYSIEKMGFSLGRILK